MSETEKCMAELLAVCEAILAADVEYMADDSSTYPDEVMAHLDDLKEAVARVKKSSE